MTEFAQTQVVRVPQPYPAGWRTLRKVLTQPRGLVGLACIVLILLVVILGPLFAPHGIDEYVGAPFSQSAAGMPFGTDFMGSDVLSRALHGGATVVWMSVAAASIGMVVGTFIGLIAAFRGGWIDEVLMRLSDVLMAMPVIVFVLLFVSVFGREHWLLVLLIGISHIPQVARVVRGSTLDVVHREFVEHARAIGTPVTRNVLIQVMPNITGTLMVEYGLRIVWSVAGLASLSVLGLGVAAPAADWGLMINENRIGLTTQPLAVVVPLMLITIFALGVNLLSEGVARAQRISGEGAKN